MSIKSCIPAIFGIALICTMSACGGDDVDVTADAGQDLSVDATLDAGPGPTCGEGDMGCKSSQVCVHPFCGSYSDGGDSIIPCPIQPAPYCVDVPSACGNNPTCACGVILPEECSVVCDSIINGQAYCPTGF